MADKKRKWRTPKQWYDEEYRPKTWWDYAYRKGADEGFALVLLGSSFLIRYATLDRWAWPTWRDVLISIPFMLIGTLILLRHRSAAFKRKEAREWGWHDPEIKPMKPEEGTGYRATCRCGWQGAVWNSEDEAFFEQLRHAVAEDDIKQATKSKAKASVASPDGASQRIGRSRTGPGSPGAVAEKRIFWRTSLGFGRIFKRRQAAKREVHAEEIFELKSAEGVLYQPACRCGWSGLPRRELDDLVLDHLDHVLLEKRKREAIKGNDQS